MSWFSSYLKSSVGAKHIKCLHLAHGVTSFFQSLGLNYPKYNPIIRNAGPAYTGLIFIDDCSIPITAWAGVIILPGA